MKKNLLTLGILAISLSVQAQILLHVDNTARMYVSNGTLVYNGGGLQTKGDGRIDLYGNLMIQKTSGSSDVIKTITNPVSPTLPVDKVDGNNIVLKLNTGTPATATYGQLYITGFAQDDITAIVDKEYANSRHGAYQQIGVPFFNKTFASLSNELAGGAVGANVFNETRWAGKEILKWSNTFMRFDGSIIPSAPIPNASVAGITIQLSTATTAADRTAYYTVGALTSGGYDPQVLRTVKGRPYADGISPINLIASAVPASFGAGGTNRNVYQERYNTYIGDPFNGVGFGSGSFARNLYQFSNPYLTNLDLTFIGFQEAGTTHDNNSISNIYGITVDPQNVTWNNSTGGTSQYLEAQKVTFDATSKKPTGNFNTLVIKPLNTFKVKLRDNASQTLSFDNLRRFGFNARTEGASNPYSVTALKNTNVGAIKQLGVIALDSDGNQLGETYYVVAPQFTTGFVSDPSISSVQAVTSTTNAIIQTFEEAPAGGIDNSYSSTYRLYINEANETNYLGKRIDLNLYGQNVASLKFELRDDTVLVPNATHLLSSGTGFYYNVGTTGQPVQIKQGDIIPVNNSNFGLYYGTPQTSGSLNTVDTNTKSRTLITYNPDIDYHIVRFDPIWKTASVEVFDASGKLVISEKSVKTNSDYVIKLDSTIKGVYIVRVVGNEGSIVNGKILIK
ncbi:T9SS type A sorting domain-containing protein [Chryseobacterium formosus]|uniref:T9SS type A sorting domain-containing protein n=1 Tax=Chryseobacterium formosus TaxID=1537363 RepID=A0ABT3XWC1_9FLAO|nr:T9SS type A sorting domain-containing protein [Chryseobacterium formosus]MCX8525964.1 T9SS type A sorting domain-containing protein [Chryseobacterium formosus]